VNKTILSLVKISSIAFFASAVLMSITILVFIIIGFNDKKIIDTIVLMILASTAFSFLLYIIANAIVITNKLFTKIRTKYPNIKNLENPPKKLLVSLAVLGVLIATAFVVDEKSINEQNSDKFPDANDVSSWYLPKPSNDEKNLKKYSFVSSTTTYPLTYENIANGKIALKGLAIELNPLESGLEQMGHILFKNGEVSDCFDSNYDQSTCENFTKGMLRLHDVIDISQEIKLPNHSDEEYGLLAGFTILEYTKGSEIKLQLVSLHSAGNNIYSIQEKTDVDLPIGNKYSLVYDGAKSPLKALLYYYLEVKSDTNKKEFVFIGRNVRWGPIYEFLERSGEVIFGKFNHTKMDLDDFGVTKQINLGILNIPYHVDSFSLSESYGSNLFYQWDVKNDLEMYHKDDCGVPYTFSDISLGVGSNLDILTRLDVSIPNQKIFYNLTTVRYGYDPAKWGTVTDVINVDDYRNAIINGKPFDDYATELQIIAGTSVRHTLPFNSPRPCETLTREQYQWIKDNNIYTLGFSYDRDHVLTPVQKNFIRNTLEEIIIGANYVPASATVE